MVEKTKWDATYVTRIGILIECLKKGKITKRDTSSEDALATTIDEIGYDSIVILLISSSKKEGTWVLDSGCTFHMMP